MSQSNLLFPTTIAVETFVYRNGVRVLTPGEALSRRHTLPGVGSVLPGFADDQVRLCTIPLQEPDGIIPLLSILREFVEEQECVIVTFEPVRRSDNDQTARQPRLQSAVWNTPHYQVLFGLTNADDTHHVLYDLAYSGSTLIDFDVTELKPSEKLLCLNLLNAAAPTFLQVAKQEFGVLKSGRHRICQYMPQERLPLWWRWQSSLKSYRQQIVPLMTTFPYREERFANHDVLGSGVFHFAQLHSATGRDIIRLWVLPTLYPVQVMFAVKSIDAWLREAIPALRGKRVKSLEMASKFMPNYMGREIITEEVMRSYWWGSL